MGFFIAIDLTEDNSVLIIQTTDGLNTANSYVSADELSNYTTARGIVLTGDLSQLLLRGMDYIESKQYKSDPLNATQSTLFPRLGVAVPRNIKQAQIMLAIAADSIDLLKATNDTQTKKEKIDSIEVEYFDSAATVTVSPLLTIVYELLEPYLASTKHWVANVGVHRG